MLWTAMTLRLICKETLMKASAAFFDAAFVDDDVFAVVIDALIKN